jgi:hypothetical protein
MTRRIRLAWRSRAVAAKAGRAGPASGCVELCHQLAVGCAGGRQLLLGQVEPVAGVDELLLELDDPVLESIDVLWRAEGQAPQPCRDLRRDRGQRCAARMKLASWLC